MIMRKIVYAVFAVLVILLSGCEYNPLYDGQKLTVYSHYGGLIKEDGGHIYMPEIVNEPYVLEILGGKGKKHSVVLDTPEYLTYKYTEGAVEPSIFEESYLRPAQIEMIPQKVGVTSVTVADCNTGESRQVNVHVCNAFNVMQIDGGQTRFGVGTIFAFEYGGPDDIVKICKGEVYRNTPVEHIVDGRYKFTAVSDSLYFEIRYPADDEGKPCKDGKEYFRRYRVELYWGGAYGTTTMMSMMRLDNLNLNDGNITGLVEQDNYYTSFNFVDVTDNPDPDMSVVDHETDIFQVDSAQIIPWILD